MKAVSRLEMVAKLKYNRAGVAIAPLELVTMVVGKKRSAVCLQMQLNLAHRTTAKEGFSIPLHMHEQEKRG